MCVGYRGVFRLPVIGRAGKKPVDRSYLQSVEERARAIKSACRARTKAEKKEVKPLIAAIGKEKTQKKRKKNGKKTR